MIVDVKKLEAEARQEIAEEHARLAKAKIRDKLRAIAAARQVVTNLEGEYAVLLRDIAAVESASSGTQ